MSDTPKFEVIDRRKMKAEEEREGKASAPPAEEPSVPSAGPQLVTSEPKPEGAPAAAEPSDSIDPEMPPPPTAEESLEQKSAYDASAQRIDDLARAQNPGMGPQQPINFESLVQQFYISAMIQLGAGAREGERPRVDILGARQTIDLLGILAEKTKGNLTPAEDRMLDTVLFEARMAFMELTNMIAMQGVQPPAPPPVEKK